MATRRPRTAEIDHLLPTGSSKAAAALSGNGAQQYLNHLLVSLKPRYRAESIAVYLLEVAYFEHWYATRLPGQDAGLADVTDVADYLDGLSEAGLADATRRLAHSCLRTYFGFRDDREDNPARDLPLPPRSTPALRPYRVEEAEAIIAAAAHAADRATDPAGRLLAARDHAMLEALFCSGVRRGELRRLRIGSVDLPSVQLSVHGKGGKPRTIAIPRRLVDVLDRYLTEVRGPAAPEEFLFGELADDGAGPAWRSVPVELDRCLRIADLEARKTAEDSAYGLDRYTVETVTYRYGRAAGVDGPHGPHRWRRTHATTCLQAGMSLEQVAKRLGHSEGGAGQWNPTALRYVYLHDDHLAAVVREALPRQ